MRLPRTLLLLAVGAAIAPAQSLNIFPILTCIDYDPALPTYIAHFGYDNQETSSAFVPIGVTNFFNPPPGFRGQPVDFAVGRHDDVFTVSLPVSTSYTWTLLGHQLTPTTSATQCTTTQFLPTATAGVPYSQRIIVTGTTSYTFRDPSALPAGLTISPDGLLSGTLALPGIYRILVRYNETTSNVFFLKVVDTPGYDENASRTRATLPPIRTVTTAAGAVNATATCDANEILISGGGTCTVTGTNTVAGRIATSQPSGNGWQVSCNNGLATAVAVCALK